MTRAAPSQDPYFTPTAWKEADQKRAKEIDQANASRVLSTTPKYPWEIQAEIVASKTARIKDLEIEVAALKKQVNRMERKLYRNQKVDERKRDAKGRIVSNPNSTLVQEILDAMPRFPRSAAFIHEKVKASYGDVTLRTIERTLSVLRKDGRVRKEEWGWRAVK